MVDIDVFIKCQKLTWMKRLIQSPDAPWAKLFSSLICAEKFYLLGPLWTQMTVIFQINSGRKFSWHGAHCLLRRSLINLNCYRVQSGTIPGFQLSHSSTPIGTRQVF